MKTVFAPVKQFVAAPRICAPSSHPAGVCRASSPFTQQKKAASDIAAQEDIYIGKGKFIRDDPKKYPSRDAKVGGWAGGEQALWEFRDSIVQDGSGQLPAKTPTGTQIIRKLDGNDMIYIGKGEFLKDDARKYPDRDPAGMRTGGFAGGELGVKAFNEKGVLDFADPSTVQQRQRTKDLILAGTLIALTSGSVYLLTQQGLIDLSWLTSAAVSTSTEGSLGAGSVAESIGSSTLSVVGRGVAASATVAPAQAKVVQSVVLTFLAAGVGLGAVTTVKKRFANVGSTFVDSLKRGVVTFAFGAVVVAAGYVVLIEN